MFSAGEASGDLLAAELIPQLLRVLEERGGEFRPRLYGAGGPRMQDAGMELLVDMTEHSAIGISDVLKKLLTYRRFFHRMLTVAEQRLPDALICVDFSGFNRRFAHAVKERVRKRGKGWFQQWDPKIIQYVSPQVWASRPARADKMQHDFDLVLALFPFEKLWYARRTPRMRVEFVGQPMLDRYADQLPDPNQSFPAQPNVNVLLLPGSRPAEIRRHLPVLLEAIGLLRQTLPGLTVDMVLPNDRLAAMAKAMGAPGQVAIQIGGLPQALLRADLALASTGTVTMECALFAVPTVTMYKTSWVTYQLARKVVTVPSLTMPNLLANESLFPEFIQDRANAGNIARAALELLQDTNRRRMIREKLGALRDTLGGPGATSRAAEAIADLLCTREDRRGRRE
jgi:lipid-A-disaccharide synthase